MRALAMIGGAALAIAVLALFALGLDASYSPSGWLMLLGAALVAGGMLSAPLRRVRRRGVTRAGAALVLLVIAGRLVLAGRGDTTMITLPDASGSRWLGRVIDEQDASLIGARALLRVWRLDPDERSELVPAMHDAFVAMRAAEGTTPSPMSNTVLGRQRPDAFDALVIEPHRGAPRAGLIFLHGYAGSATLECWMIAEAARAIDAVTVCPATTFAGRWWEPDGERTLRATLDYLERRGVARAYLAGLSNGGVGAIKMAPRFARSLAGLVLISGVSAEGSTAGLPALVVQGTHDSNVSAATARAFATRTGATYASFDGGHFVMLIRRAEVRDAIAAWLEARERR